MIIYKTQPCGCEFKYVDDKLEFSLDKINYNCTAVWDLLAKGLTKGVFQLESPLGKQWVKRLKPANMDHVAALGALLRPGCLRAIDEDGVSMTQHYARRKNGEEDVSYFHPALEPILKNTYGVLCYQEQQMQIAQQLAGFDLQKADELRKATGKKLAEEMAKVKVKFIDGCREQKIVTEAEAEQIFGWIEKGSRYSFNASHSFSYGIIGYITAYLKAHFPLQFYTSWLRWANEKSKPLQEIAELVAEAKLMDIQVEPPDIRSLEEHFSTDGKTVRFGLCDIKGIADSQISKLKQAYVDHSPKENSWLDLLFNILPKISSTVSERLIQVGALRYLGISRRKLLTEYRTFKELTPGEQKWLIEHQSDNLVNMLKAAAFTKKEGGAAHSKNRAEIIKSLVKLLEQPPTSLEDPPYEVAYNEEEYLGVPITYSVVDSCDGSAVNCTCKEFLSGRRGNLILGVEIKELREVTTKKGKNAGSKMAFLRIEDSSCSADAVIFADTYGGIKNVLYEGNIVGVRAERDKGGSLIIKKVWTLL